MSEEHQHTHVLRERRHYDPTVVAAEAKLVRIRSLVVGVGRAPYPNDGMNLLADAVLRILDEPA